MATPLQSPGCDFDADGFADQAIGIPGEAVSGVDDAGAVHVLYGSATGLAAARNRLWHQDSLNVAGTAGAGDRFGEATTCGDFNADRFDDLAVGVLGEDEAARDGGAVNVIYGSRVGLVRSEAFLWTQDSPDVAGSCRALRPIRLGARVRGLRRRRVRRPRHRRAWRKGRVGQRQ